LRPKNHLRMLSTNELNETVDEFPFAVIHVKGSLKLENSHKFYYLAGNISENKLINEFGTCRYDVLSEVNQSDNFLLIMATKVQNKMPTLERLEYELYNNNRNDGDGNNFFDSAIRDAGKYYYRPLFPEWTAWASEPTSTFRASQETEENKIGFVAKQPPQMLSPRSQFPLSVVVVDILVTPGSEDAFKNETIRNCKASALEVTEFQIYDLTNFCKIIAEHSQEYIASTCYRTYFKKIISF